jgi:small subunit ribosomal protein S19
MSRSLKKGPYINEKLLKKISLLRPGDKTITKTWDRACTITPEMVGFKIGVHNGREHITVDIVENMVGHKLGEFSITKKFVVHGGKMAKEQQKGPETAAAPAAAAKPAPKK